MAHYVLLFDRPADLDGTGYRQRSRNWIAEMVRLDGFQEFSAHWNAIDASVITPVTSSRLPASNPDKVSLLRCLFKPYFSETLVAHTEATGDGNDPIGALPR